MRIKEIKEFTEAIIDELIVSNFAYHPFRCFVAGLFLICLLTIIVYLSFCFKRTIGLADFFVPTSIILFSAIIIFLIFAYPHMREHEVEFSKVMTLRDGREPELRARRDRNSSMTWLCIYTEPSSSTDLSYLDWLLSSFDVIDEKNDTKFDFEKYTYIITWNYELKKITYSDWHMIKYLSSGEKLYKGTAWLSDNCDEYSIYIYRINKKYIDSERAYLGASSSITKFIH